ncbi:MAG TPA: hypothetical protein VI954_01255 [Candidatus Paceibacterota bacterium]
MISFLLVFIAWLCSLGGIAFIVAKKLPALREAAVSQGSIGWRDVVKEWLISLQRSSVAQNNHPEKLLHRILSRTRIFMLRSEHLVSTWLERLRIRTQEKNQTKISQEQKNFSEDYWGQLKNKKDAGEKNEEED